MAMRRLVVSMVAALVVAVLAGCGGSDTATDDPSGSGSPSDSASTSPTDGGSSSGSAPAGYEFVTFVTVTGAGGTVSTQAVPLADAPAVEAFTGQFTNDQMKSEVITAATGAQVPAGKTLYAAVVSIGCTPPGDVTAAVKAGTLTLTAVGKPSPSQECFAPETTVALVLVNTDAVSG